MIQLLKTQLRYNHFQEKMPMLIKAAFGPSTVPAAGEGLIVQQKVAKGATIWIADERVPNTPTEGSPNLPNIILTKELAQQLKEKLPRQAFSDLIHHCLWYKEGNLGIVLREGIAKLNHCKQKQNGAVVRSKDNDWRKLKIVALRDIEAGQEVLIDYSCVSKRNGWLTPFVKEYDPERLQLEEDLKIYPTEGQFEE